MCLNKTKALCDKKQSLVQTVLIVASHIKRQNDKRKITCIPPLRTRNTISSRAEFDGAHTRILIRYLRLEVTASGF